MAHKPMISRIAPAMGTQRPQGKVWKAPRRPKTMQDRILSSNGGGI